MAVHKHMAAGLAGGLLVAITLSASAAQVYRCTDDTGRTEYRDLPCRNQPGGQVRIEPNVVPGVDARTLRETGQAIDARTAARVGEEQAARNRAAPSDRPSAEAKPAQTPYWLRGAFDP